MRKILSILSILLVLCLGAITVIAQETEKPAAEAGQEAEKAAPAPKAKAAAKAETISGTVTTVSKDNLLIVTSSNNIPYNFKLTRGTRIKVAGQKGKIDDLAAQTGKQVSVEFLPLRTGNMARSVEVSQ